jgi:tryptophan synthase alpha chain
LRRCSLISGLERIAAAFESARADGRRAALMPYLMGGFPDVETSFEIGRACAGAGADLLELGVPFSDPLADGPVIHAAGTAALQAGTTVSAVMQLAGRLAREGIAVVLMCYANLILARGLARFADQLADAGASGLIVPDLPLEEGDAVLEACDQRAVALVPLVAPTTPDGRLQRIGAQARGFVYAVSLRGTTGERDSLSEALPKLIGRVRTHASVPVAVGFGIGTPDQARGAADAGADGVIIGTRLVRAAAEAGDPARAVGELVGEFAAALSTATVK